MSDSASYTQVTGKLDLISRQDAITVCNSAIDLWEGQLGVGALVAVRDKIAELTIEPERKKGEWVRYDGDWLKTMCKCSECGAMIDINEKYRNFFCYHCGARMDGEEDDEERSLGIHH